MRIFFGGTFINNKEFEEKETNYLIKLEYYKEINEDEINNINSKKYGIYIVKTKYMPNNTQIEEKDIKYVTNDEMEEDRILNIFKENQVTIINSEEVISDLFKASFN